MKSKRVKVENEIKAMARERVGAPKPSRAIVPKADRKKPKHKKSDLPGAEEFRK